MYMYSACTNIIKCIGLFQNNNQGAYLRAAFIEISSCETRCWRLFEGSVLFEGIRASWNCHCCALSKNAFYEIPGCKIDK